MRAGYDGGEANSLIQNFRKPADRRGKPEWHYKKQAETQFALELLGLLPYDAVIAHIPTSLLPTNPLYNTRFEDILGLLIRHRPTIRFDQPVGIQQERGAAHSGEIERDPRLIAANLAWKGLGAPPDRLFVIDDMISLGAHFAAFRDLVVEKHPATEVVGVFWSRCMWIEPAP